MTNDPSKSALIAKSKLDNVSESAAAKTSPSSVALLPTSMPSAVVPSMAPHRPPISQNPPSLQDASKSAFTVFSGPPSVRSPFPGRGPASNPSGVQSGTVASPFSASAIGQPSSSASSVVTQPLVTKAVPRTIVAETVVAASGPSSSSTPSNPNSNPSAAPMASIIRGTSHIQQISSSHLSHPAVQAAYSSHVPRGAAAVACITTLKSAVATPNPRTTQIYQSGLLSGAHTSLQTRNPSLQTLRALPPPVSRTLSPASDIHRTLPLVTNNLTASKLLIASPRVAGDATVRQTLVHSTAALTKNQPFLQQIQQLPDKGFYRPNYASTAVLPIQTVQAPIPSPSVPSQAKSLITHSLPSAHLVSHSQLVAHGTLPATTVVGPMVTASLIATTPSQSHTHLPKVIAQAIHTVAPIPQLQAAAGSISLSSARPDVTTAVVVTHSLPRPIVSTGASIPVAKVYPQPLTVATRPIAEIAQHTDGTRSAPTTTLFISPTQQRSSANVAVSPAAASSVPGSVVGTGIPIASTGVVLAESKPDRATVQNATTYTIPGATTYYYESYTGVGGPTLAMHTFSNTAGSHPFAAVSTTTLRTGLLHPASVRAPVSNTAPITISPVMVSMTTNRHSLPVPNNGFSSSINSIDSSTSLNMATTTASSSLTLASSYTGSPVQTGAITSSSVTPSSSPRPSILRKRTIDGASMAVRKNLMSSLPSSRPQSPHTEGSGSNITVGTSSSSSSPKTPFGPKDANHDNVHSSEGNDSCCNGEHSLPLVIKQELMDTDDPRYSAVTQPTASGMEASPRKKPRKQQLTGNELIETHSTEGEDDFEGKTDIRDNRRKEIVKEDEDGVCWVSTRQRRPVAILHAYRHSWKSRQNHFVRYTDIKLKDERRPTVGDLVNQKRVLQKANGWKMYHICAQIEDLADLESTVHSRLTDLLENMERKVGTKEAEDLNINRANELVRGNLQRCKIIRDQMKDAHSQILKVLDHKSRVVDILTKHISKQPSRKREKN